ncbi:MAG: DUF6609 family protein [Leucobacter sp.]
MLDFTYARDLAFTGAIFGLVAFVWAGWAHERPPKGAIWRILLVIIQLAGAGIVGLGVPTIIKNWNTPTAMVAGNPALLGQMIWTWVEVVAIVVIVVILVRKKRTELIAPCVLIAVGVHFFPLAFVFGQPIIFLVGVLVTIAGVVALFLPRRVAAPSFWCGILAGPVYVVFGAIALFTARAALGG